MSALTASAETPPSAPAKTFDLPGALRRADDVPGLAGWVYRRVWANLHRQSASLVAEQMAARQDEADAGIATIIAERERRHTPEYVDALKAEAAARAARPVGERATELPPGWSAEEIAEREEAEARSKAARWEAEAEAAARAIPKALAMLDGGAPDAQTESADAWLAYAVWRGGVTQTWWDMDTPTGEALQERTRQAGRTAAAFEEALTALAALSQEPRFARLDHHRGERAWWVIRMAQHWVDVRRVPDLATATTLALGILLDAERAQAGTDVRGVLRGECLPSLRWYVRPEPVETYFGDLLQRDEVAVLRRACPWLVREFDDDEIGVGEVPSL